jgi:hypothetical protein
MEQNNTNDEKIIGAKKKSQRRFSTLVSKPLNTR